jgi:hypothetical protein
MGSLRIGETRTRSLDEEKCGLLVCGEFKKSLDFKRF